MKKYLLSLILLLNLVSCTEKPKNEFFIIQNGKVHSGEEVTLENKVFTLGSNKKGYSFVFSKTPIEILAENKEIIKLTGTSAAWYPKQAELYESDTYSSLLTNKDACMAYYGDMGERCQIFLDEKEALGFGEDYVYTFADYFVPEMKMDIESIDKVTLVVLRGESYFVYFFRDTDKMGDVATKKNVARIKINIR